MTLFSIRRKLVHLPMCGTHRYDNLVGLPTELPLLHSRPPGSVQHCFRIISGWPVFVVTLCFDVLSVFSAINPKCHRPRGTVTLIASLVSLVQKLYPSPVLFVSHRSASVQAPVNLWELSTPSNASTTSSGTVAR